ncbi:hypothetical protein BKA69DRAFT_1096218 [Paraphysoderma sedebokerense]|nr:hypothetical protein BKA69DRAFT_1096218 [Paraphysoderma sedebokerense]
MPFPDTFVRSTFGNGPTDLAFILAGEYLVTADKENIRIWHTAAEKRNNEPLPFDADNFDTLTCLAGQGSKFAYGNDLGEIYMVDANDLEDKKLISRFTLHPRTIAFSTDGKLVAVGGDDLMIRIMNVNDITDSQELHGFSKPVKSVAFDPLKNYLASVDASGCVKIFNLNSEPIAIEKNLEKLTIAKESEEPETSRLAWHPWGKYLAVPGTNNDILILKRSDFSTAFTLSSPHENTVTQVAWSPNGQYLASIDMDKRVVIWNMETKESIYSNQHSHDLRCIAFHPTENCLVYSDSEASFIMVDSVIPKDLPDPVTKPRKDESSKPTLNLFDDNQVSNKHSSAGHSMLGKSNFVDDDAIEDNEPEKVSPDDMEEEPYGSDLDDFIIDDEPGAEVRQKKKAEKKKIEALAAVAIQNSKMQSRFQPGATKERNGMRYLAFNMIGVIHTVDESAYQVVHVEFHDRSTYRSFHFNDPRKFTMAALGDRAALFAVETDDETNTPSTISLRSFDSWANKSDWVAQLHKDEDVKAIAMGSRHAIVVTSKHYVRIFSIAGVRTYMFSLDGPIVAVTAHRNLAVFVYHADCPLNGNQRLNYILFDLEKNKEILHHRLSLTPKSLLAWIGFSDDNMPISYDTKGTLRGLLPHANPHWIPLLDTSLLHENVESELEKPTYWPVGVTGKDLMCIICKGINKEPGFPRPMMCDIELKSPITHLDGNTDQLEEKRFRMDILNRHVQDEAVARDEFDVLRGEIQRKNLEIDKVLIQLIQAACKNEKTQRAYDLATLLHLPKTIDAAIKLAAFHHMPALAERINGVKEARVKQLEREEEERSRPVWERSLNLGHQSSVGSGFSEPRHDDQFVALNTKTFKSGLKARKAKADMEKLQKSSISNSTIESESYQSPQNVRDRRVTEDSRDQVDRAEEYRHEIESKLGSSSPAEMGSKYDEYEKPVSVSARREVDSISDRKKAGNPFLKKANPFAAPASVKQTKAIQRSNSFFAAVESPEKLDDGKRKAFVGLPCIYTLLNNNETLTLFLFVSRNRKIFHKIKGTR